MMKVLFIAPWVPSNTRPRSLALLRELTKSHDVRVVVAAWSESEANDSSLLPVSEPVVVRTYRLGAYIRSAIALLTRKSLQQSYVDSSRLERRIIQELAEFNPDMVYFNVARSAQFVRLVGSAIKVIDLDEFRSDYYRQVRESSRQVIRRFVARIEEQRLLKAERRILRSFDLVLVSSPRDLRDEDPKIQLVRSATSTNKATIDSSSEVRTRDIVFVGRQDYRANEEAIQWYVRRVLPNVEENVPGVRLIIVGDKPTNNTRKLAKQNVIVTGRVPDVGEYYRSAAVAIAPITMATGVQMKLIDSLNRGVPTIVTSRVANAAGIEHERECLVADSAAEWASATTRLLFDDELSDALGKRGQLWAIGNHSVDSVGVQFRTALKSLDSLSETWSDV